jgi:4a-hydroxytetrahydrobiopterin dehydratase
MPAGAAVVAGRVNLPVVNEDVDLLDDQAIESRLAELEGWERDGDTITKTFKCGDFVGSVGFVQKLVEPAEDMGHHPDLSLSWDEVRVTSTTHAAGGLTRSDFELAKRIDALTA